MFTESTCRVLTGIVLAPFVTSRKSSQMQWTTSFVRIESRSIATSVRRCTSPKALIDLMEPISVLPLPISSSRLTTRILFSRQKYTSTNRRFLDLTLQESVVPSTSSLRRDPSPTPGNVNSVLMPRWELAHVLTVPSKDPLLQRVRIILKFPNSLSNSERLVIARAGTVVERTEQKAQHLIIGSICTKSTHNGLSLSTSNNGCYLFVGEG